MVLTLYKLDASPPVRAVLMTIEVLEIPDVKYIEVNILNNEHLTEDYMKLNPQHTIPTLKDDDFVIWDSHAISSYLVSTYGKNDSLYPSDKKKRAIVDQRLHFNSSVLFPAMKHAAGLIFFRGEKNFSDESLNQIQSAYELTNKLLTTDWLAGENITLADICCVSSISTMNEMLPIDKNRYMNLWTWFQRCSQQPFYKNMNEPGLLQFRALLKTKLKENANK